MSFQHILCPHCYATEERYISGSTDPHCSFCGNFLNGQKALTSEEYYRSMGCGGTSTRQKEEEED